MNRQEKQDLLDKLSEMYAENKFIFLVSVNAVNASNALNFRADIRKNNAKCLLAKNTLSKIAAKNANLEALNQYFEKTVMTVFANSPVEVAKLLEDYESKGYSVLAGSDKAGIMTATDIKKLAKVPPMPVLRGMFLSTLLGVQRKTARLLSERSKKLAEPTVGDNQTTN
jgi:large subunit ribosomal protein L10